MSAELLRRAGAEVRGDGPYELTEDVAAKVADLLDAWADQVERREALGMEVTEVSAPVINSSVALARAILREDS